MKRCLSAALAFLLSLAGCQALNPSPPIEVFATRLAEQAVIPAVQDGIAQGIRSLQVQAGAQGINPAYVITIEGKWVVGFEASASVGVDGLAGQLQISAAGDDQTVRSPSRSAGDGQ